MQLKIENINLILSQAQNQSDCIFNKIVFQYSNISEHEKPKHMIEDVVRNFTFVERRSPASSCEGPIAGLGMKLTIK